jgi:ABC-2 type transport system permease protein
MDFISGSFIPLMLLPSVIREIFSLTPFYYILYFPASLYLEQGWNKMGRALGVILVWNLILWGFRKIQYRRMIRIYEGVGA